MELTREQKLFLVDMDINEATFLSLNRDVQILIDIAEDYELHKNDLLDEAGYIANKLQRCKGVHSVRSRIKDTSHLIEKIIRKWSLEQVSQKYDEINKNNYKSTITDLVGVRAIYLFKSDWETVHDHILSKWEPKEEVVIYHRQGDDLSLYEDHSECKKEVHFSGYRSIHYLIPATKINGEQIYCEVQTRTIFEEGWSEIDHKVRYPNFSDNPYLQEFLDIFNRISGSADEMGSFVNSLRELIQMNNILEDSKEQTLRKHEAEIKELEEKIERLFKEKAELQDIQAAYNSLKAAKNLKNQIEQLNVDAIKSLNSELASNKGMASLLGVDPQLLSSALGLHTKKAMESALGLHTKRIIADIYKKNDDD
ncbi:hypothetical protein NI401_13260 [Acinetobacter indicus]|uniref:RelA/SpoT domain-containing protein n=1 Tax=Acinetobacter indicus TaxID=756892 RepID=UPI00209AD459|nr:hypothetical protein [Acinetobacter indicus]MCO8103858.1 hypothetical protein [Acinetobacter indicus]